MSDYVKTVSILKLTEEVVQIYKNQPYIEIEEDPFEFEKSFYNNYCINKPIVIKRLKITPLSYNFKNKSEKQKHSELKTNNTNTVYLAIDPKVEECIKDCIGYYDLKTEYSNLLNDHHKSLNKIKSLIDVEHNYITLKCSFWKRLKFLFTG